MGESTQGLFRKGRGMTEKRHKLLLGAGVFLVIFWRLYVCCSYHYRYLDDDQAVLWYGTVMFAHGSFPEPCFFGQNYGSMIEALFAVPLFLCRWPLNIALPTVTTILCLLPFIFLICVMIRRKNWMQAWIILMFLAAMGWQWDAVTSLPRALIGGFPFAVIGVILLNEEDDRKWKAALGTILCFMGITITTTTISVVGIGVVYRLVRYKSLKAKMPAILFGSIVGGMCYGGQRLFYRIHPEHALYLMDKGKSSLEVFLYNMRFLPERMTEFCFAGKAGMVLIPVLLVFSLYYMIRKKNYLLLVITLISVAGSLFMISYHRTMQFYENSILFGQLRTVLYMSFLALTILGLAGISDGAEGCKDYDRKKYRAFPIAVVLILGWKVLAFTAAVNNEESALYNGELVNIYSVDSLKEEAKEMVELAHSANADILVTVSYARFFAYAAKALYYDDPVEFYIPDCDRRVWVYQRMQEPGDHRMLLFSLPVSENMYADIIELHNDSPVAYFEREFGLVRGGEDVWGIPLGETED